ncbi:uncharacterized protein [Onthophagus taurus]|uniref:uncharacterized protein n=1 Tax=Onthophagus taurus TaxID=166361 RepID=UPI0039BE33E3
MGYLGIGYSGVKIFCGLMDLCVPACRSTYNTIIKKIRNAASAIATVSMNTAVREEIECSENKNSLVVSGDGSWRKRACQSLHGIASLIGNYTGKVLDVVVKSSYCAACKIWEHRCGTSEYLEWLNIHEEECNANHEGNAGKMEADAIIEMFESSESKYDVKYKYYIGDGDSKTFKTILTKKPYGAEFEIYKRECVGHVQKRMGTRLRSIKKEKKLGGVGKLTDNLIGELTKYYGKAIRANSDSVEKMKNSIWATYYHKCSTDDHPQHEFCPVGPESWCSWRKAEAEGKLETYIHKPAIRCNVQREIFPIYEALSDDTLLQRCLGGYSQNANECFNNKVWKIAPKTSFSGTETIEIAAFLATAVFNDGCHALLALFEKLNISYGNRTVVACQEEDNRRLHDSDISVQRRSKQSRIKKIRDLQKKADEDIGPESCFYLPGNF